MFRNIRQFNPNDVLTDGVKARVFLPMQADRSRQATTARKEKKEVEHKRRMEVVRAAVSRLSKARGFDLSAATYKSIFEECELQWAPFHILRGIKKEYVPRIPSLNTMKPAIDEVRLEILGRSQKNQPSG